LFYLKAGTWSVHTKNILLLTSRLRNNQDSSCLVISCLNTNKGHVNSIKKVGELFTQYPVIYLSFVDRSVVRLVEE